MKKEFLFAAAAAMVLASCSSDETIGTNDAAYGITFRASVDKATRVTETTASNLSSFNVTAIGDSKNYFSGLTVSSTNNGSTWSTNKIYYWPSYKLAFFAWSNAAENAEVSISGTEHKITGFTPSKDVKSQKDFVVSYNTGTKEANNGSGVTMNFKHALSQIAVQAKCSNNNMKVEVLGVKLVNMATTADFTFPEAETTASSALAQGQWSNLSDKDTHANAYMVKGKSAVTLSSEAQDILFEESLMLIPQKLTKWDGTATRTGAYLAVLCRVSSLNGEEATLLYPEPTATDTKDGKYAFTAVGIDTNWEPGKKYTYTLDFCNGVNGGCGQIAPDLANPLDASDSQVDTTPIVGKSDGYTILGPITFKAEVDDWTAESKDTSM